MATKSPAPPLDDEGEWPPRGLGNLSAPPPPPPDCLY